MARSALPSEVEIKTLVESRRRCCICFALKRDRKIKAGQIAHLDRNSSNHAPTNLVFLCLDHHDQYDGRTSQSKGFKMLEVKTYKEELLHWLSSGRDPNAETNTFEEQVLEQFEAVIGTQKAGRPTVTLDDVDPLMSLMRKAHEDFLSILRALHEIGERVEDFLLLHPHEDWVLDDIIARNRTVGDLCESGRASRRELFEAASFYREELIKKAANHELGLIDEETRFLHEFFDSIKDYFSKSASEYGHPVRAYVQQSALMLHHMKHQKLAASEIQDLLSDVRDRYRRSETIFEDIWPRVSRSYAAIRAIFAKREHL